ncbi:MAG TPA: SpoIIE family protein phosphatase [Acidimicrobiales bacterium]|nr:SpoIIE family protein phosphatase [Acidimicrobiales bacterium]
MGGEGAREGGAARGGAPAGAPDALPATFLAAVVEASPDGVLAVSPDRTVLAVNRRFSEMWRLADDAVRVGDTSPALTGLQAALLRDPAGFEAAIRWGHEHPTETQQLDLDLTDGRAIEAWGAPVLDRAGRYLGRIWHMRDVTHRRRGAAAQVALAERLATAERAQRFLLACADALARSSGFSGSLRALAGAAVPTLGDLCLIDVVAERGGVRRVAAVHADPSLQALAAHLEAWPPDPAGDHPAVVAMRERRSRLGSEVPPGLLATTTRGAPHLEVLEALRADSYMSVPLLAGDVVLGAVTLVTTGSGRQLSADDLALAEELAGRVVRVVAKERRFDQEHQAAHTLQASLLPAHPEVPAGFEVAVRYLPATRQAEVGGDFWDVAAHPAGAGIALAVGDVEGHDMVAAAQMAQLRSALRALRPGTDGSGGLLAAVRRVWDDLALPRLATALVATIDDTGLLRAASAGHPPPLLVEPGAARSLDVPVDVPLGVAPGAAGAPRPLEVRLAAGAALVLYTDGLVERRDAAFDAGVAALAARAAAAARTTPETLADHLLEGVVDEDRADDVALLVVRRASG